MRLPRKHLWHEAGNRLYGTGSIDHESVPVLIWALDVWLCNADEQFGHRFQRILDPVWQRFFPDTGDPFCFAQCYIWSPFVWRHTKQEYNYPIGWDGLSPEYREWYARDFPEDEG